MQHPEAVMEHFRSPHNVGRIENPDGVGEVGNPVCGDMVTVTIRVTGNRIEDIRFETFGCNAAVAVSSVVTDMAKGRSLEEAMKITTRSVAEKLGGLPRNKLHCSNLGADALHEAIQDYLDRKEGKVRKRRDERVELIPTREGHGYCPYCNLDLPPDLPYCTNCGKPTLEHR